MRKRMITMGLLAALAGLTLPAAVAQTTSTNKSSTKATGARSRKPPQDKGPAETRAERDKRLQRECRGRPNSGACEGFGS